MGRFLFEKNVPIKDAVTGKITTTKKFRVPHHAAMFAPTRWTNLYFPCVSTIKGDVIGGPLAHAFESGIRDLP